MSLGNGAGPWGGVGHPVLSMRQTDIMCCGQDGPRDWWARTSRCRVVASRSGNYQSQRSRNSAQMNPW